MKRALVCLAVLLGSVVLVLVDANASPSWSHNPTPPVQKELSRDLQQQEPRSFMGITGGGWHRPMNTRQGKVQMRRRMRGRNMPRRRGGMWRMMSMSMMRQRGMNRNNQQQRMRTRDAERVRRQRQRMRQMKKMKMMGMGMRFRPNMRMMRPMRGRGMMSNNSNPSRDDPPPSVEEPNDGPGSTPDPPPQQPSDADDTVAQDVDDTVASDGYSDALTGVNCPAKTLPMQSNIGVTFVGDYNALTTAEISLLQSSFSLVYNELIYRQCDGYFRNIEQTTLKLPEVADSIVGPERTMEANPTPQAPQDLLFEGPYFSTSGTCRGCPSTDSDTYPLFTSPTRRRRRRTREREQDPSFMASSHHQQQRQLQNNPPLSVCTCDKDALSDRSVVPSSNAPPLDVFVQAYNDMLTQFVNAGMLVAVTQVELLDEFDQSVQVFCRDFDNRQILADVQVDFVGSRRALQGLDINLGGVPRELTDDEIAIISATFAQVYNQLAYDLCDRYFRYVVGVNYLSVSSIFQVTYTCRGCPENNFGRTTTLFQSDGGFLRRELLQKQQGGDEKEGITATMTLGDDSHDAIETTRRELQTDNIAPELLTLRTCLCPEGPNYSVFTPNAPTAEQFQAAFAQEVQALVDAGSIQSIQVGAVEEVV